jgi:hypothetical protein
MGTRVTRQVKNGADLPLPGHYGVLTFQLNYTRYHPQGTSRWTLSVREPKEGIELDRVFMDLGDDTEDTDGEILAAVQQAITQMLYMQTGLAHRLGASPTQ